MKETLASAEERASAYRLLSLCFHPPDESLLAALRDPDAGWLRPSAVPPLDELRREYARLFIGPFKVPAPPYGSVYLESEGRVLGDSTVDASARYREEGLHITLREPADHVAIELEFMYLLAHREMEAVAAGEERTAAGYLEKQRDFLRAHLGAWIPMLRERIVEDAGTGFYPHVALAAESVIDQAGRPPASTGPAHRSHPARTVS